MTTLANLTEDDIRARASEESFKRGREYYAAGALQRCIQHRNTLEAHVAGTMLYRVQVWQAGDGIRVTCDCPYDWGGDCKHIVAALLAWVNEPERFQPPLDLEGKLSRLTKKQLVALLLDLFGLNPHLVDHLDLLSGSSPRDLEQAAADIIELFRPGRALSPSEGALLLRKIAAQIDSLVERGWVKVARRAYFALAANCIGLCNDFGYDYFAEDICCEFVTAYSQLALPQLKHDRAAIEAELEALQPDEIVRDRLGLDEPLFDLEAAFGWWEEV